MTMSATGQKRRFARQSTMSALLADEIDVRFVPLATKVQRSNFCNYSITLSAVARRDDGMVSPSALAVLRLIASSYLVGA